MDTATRPRRRQYADPFACPACSHRLQLDAERCPGCGLLLQGLLARQLLQTLRIADNQLAQLVAASNRQPEPAPEPLAPPVVPPPLPRPTAPQPRGVSELTVPKLLLGLGALCLLVAAVIFLAIAWSWLGIGGRTAVLVGLTVVAGGLGVDLSRRGLRVAGESLTTVALGLLTLDVIGADNAGWLGDRTVEGLVAVLGAVVLTAAGALALTTRLVAPQVISVGALSVLGGALVVATGRETLVPAAVIIGYGGLAVAGRARRLFVLPILAAVGASWWWLGLTVHGWAQAVQHPSIRGLWSEGYGVSLLTASVLLLLPLPYLREHTTATKVLTAGAGSLLTVTLAVPASDESVTTIGVTALVALVGWTAASLVVPVAWRVVAQVPMLVGALPLGLVTAALGAQAGQNAVGTRDPFTSTIAVRLGDPDPVAAPVLLLLGAAALLGAVLSALPRRFHQVQATAALLALAAVGTAALHPVPAWTIAAALTLVGTVLVADALRTTGAYGVGETLAGVAVVALGAVVALPSDVLTALVLAAFVVLSAALWWWGSAGHRLCGSLLGPASVSALVWVGCEVAGVEQTPTVACVVALIALVGWTLACLATPIEWRPALWAAMAVAAVPVGAVTVSLGSHAVSNALVSYEPDAVAAPVLLLLGAAGLLGALAGALRWVPPVQVPAAVLSIAAVGTLALYPVPAWTVVAALTVIGAALVLDSLRYEGTFGLTESLVGVGVVGAGLAVALPSDVLATAVLAALVALAASLHGKGWVEQEFWGALLLPISLGGFLWAAGAVAAVPEDQRGVLILVAVGLLAIARVRVELEVTALAVGAVASGLAIGYAGDVSVALAVHLTVAGALVSATALVHRDRRRAGWLGGALLATATWVRLADVGVTAPEAYTLPTAVALLVVGLVQLRRDDQVSSVRALAPGLVLATVPSLLWVLVDPVTLRAAILGMACLALVVAGAALRWSAPLLIGAVVGTAVVLRELAPYALEAPQWLLIGLAGTVLTGLGITWESRLRDVRAAAAYVGRLR